MGSQRSSPIFFAYGNWGLVAGDWISTGLRFAAEEQFDEAVEDEADPGVDEQAPVEMIRNVTRGRGQVRHQDEEVEQTANEDGGELFEDTVGHGLRDSVEDGSSQV